MTPEQLTTLARRERALDAARRAHDLKPTHWNLCRLERAEAAYVAAQEDHA